MHMRREYKDKTLGSRYGKGLMGLPGKGNYAAFALLLALVICASICMLSMGLTQSYFADTEQGEARISTGSWGDGIEIHCLCPNWGISGACVWPVFLHGKHFQGEVAVQLEMDGTVIEAAKSWVICDSLIFTVFDLRQAEKGWYDVRVIAENGEAVLEDCFLVKGWFCCLPLASKDHPAGEDKLSLEKMIDTRKHETMLFAVTGELPKSIVKAYLVAPGQLLEGEILGKGDGGLAVGFDMSKAPCSDYDLVLVTGEGWNLLLERALTEEDILRPMALTAIEPSSAPAGERFDLRICGENLSDTVELWMEGDGAVIKPLETRAITGEEILCTFDLQESLPGVYTLRARAPRGMVAMLMDCFEVTEANEDEQPIEEWDEDQPLEEKAPQVPDYPEETPVGEGFNITPDYGHVGEAVELAIQGGPFSRGMRARLSGSKATAWSLESEWVTTSHMKCRFNLHGLPAGVYRLEILDYRGALVYIAGSFEVI